MSDAVRPISLHFCPVIASAIMPFKLKNTVVRNALLLYGRKTVVSTPTNSTRRVLLPVNIIYGIFTKN